jgi:hypothetical protein
MSTSQNINQRKEKSKFKELEDQKIINLVALNDKKTWDEIAKSIEDRTGRQVRERYKNYLDPEIKRGNWSMEEDQKLKSLVEQHGPRWAYLKPQFDNRSDIELKNRYNLMMRHQNSTQSKKILLNNSTQKSNSLTDVINSFELWNSNSWEGFFDRDKPFNDDWGN